MPYRIAFLSKFPPIEGGISAKTYWLTRSLALRGHEIHIITHKPEAGSEYRIVGGENLPEEIPNLYIHRPAYEIPWHIPEDHEYALSLLDTTINVIKEYGIQIIDTGYMIPYGLIGYLAKQLTGIPNVLRHGGSDIEKFLRGGVFPSLLNSMISDADSVVTEKLHAGIFKGPTSKLSFQPAYVPDDSVFKPREKVQNPWRLATIGKINYQWQHKTLKSIVEIMGFLPDGFESMIIGQGKGITNFIQSLDKEALSKIQIYPFVAPWDMPGILGQLDAIFVFETNLPHSVFSNVLLEALCMGIGIITDRQDILKTYETFLEIDKDQVLVVSPAETKASTKKIMEWLHEQKNTKFNLTWKVSFQDYLLSNEMLYGNILRDTSNRR